MTQAPTGFERWLASWAMCLIVVFFAASMGYLAFDARRARAECASACDAKGSSKFIHVPANPDSGRPEECVCRAP